MPFINPSLAAILTLSAALPLYGQSVESRIDLLGAHIRASLTDSTFTSSECSHWVRIEEILGRDGDGFSDGAEAESGGGDSNGDGIPDALQAHVASIPTLLTSPLIVSWAAPIDSDDLFLQENPRSGTQAWAFMPGPIQKSAHPYVVRMHPTNARMLFRLARP